MKENPTAVARIPFGTFFTVFIFVFTLVLLMTIITTSLEPKTYMSAARVEVQYKSADSGQFRTEKRIYDSTLAKTESEVINSEVIMRKVIGDLNLNEVWGKAYNNDETLKTWESLKLLNQRTLVYPVTGTTLIQISFYDENPDDAAKIANSIANAYTSYVATNSNELQAQIIDSAYSDKFPVRPNTTLNYLLGTLVGIFLGLLAGAGIALLVFLKNRNIAKISKS
jgi:capsular polysaccharide biosynthesis protein